MASILTIIKTFVKKHHPKEYNNFEIYNDWDQCSITVGQLNRWRKNVITSGCVNVDWKLSSNKYRTQQLAEGLHRAKSEIEEIKKKCKNNLDLAYRLTGRKLASKLDISKTTANKYLNILEGKWMKLGKKEMRYNIIMLVGILGNKGKRE